MTIVLLQYGWVLHSWFNVIGFYSQIYNLPVLMIYILLENPSSLGGHNIEYNDYNDPA